MRQVMQAVTCAAALALAPMAWAQAAADATKGDGQARAGEHAAEPKVSRGEARFLRKAAEHGMAEVELARLAQQRGLREQVQSFGARMAADHEKANLELAQLAAAKGVALPEGPGDGHRRELEKLRKHVGPDFDREFMKRMVDDHRKDLEDFEKQAKSAKDPQVKDFAARQVPVLREHLNLARATYDVARASERTGERETGSRKP